VAETISSLRRWPVLFRVGGATVLFAILTAIMTWPQAIVLSTHAVDDQDVFFNLWRLRWFAHALSSHVSLFDANIFHPERGVLAYSDALLVEGVLGAPLLYAGVPPVLVHNLLLLGAFVVSGVGMFVLARHLTGSTGGAVAAGVIFAFAPYRFAHYIHLELQWAIWSPWAFWGLQRTIETGSIRFGLLTGLCLALQMASSVYYGIFLFVLIPVVALPQLITLGGRRLARTAGALAFGLALAAMAGWFYSRPYAEASARVGTRSIFEVRRFSARPRDYRFATPTNVLYGSPKAAGTERQLFPGLLPLLLTVVGLLLARPTIPAIAYLIGLVLAFELSLGVYGELYPFLYEHVGVFQGLRAPSRASIFVLLFLGVLTAQGIAALTSSLSIRTRHAVAIVVCVGLLLEYRVHALPLVPYHNEPPPLYAHLASRAPGIVAEFPMPTTESPVNHEARFGYMSTFHWMPLVNGYSGFYPPSYLGRLERQAPFPDSSSIAALRRDNVRYVIVHDDGYGREERLRIVEESMRFGLKWLADYDDGWGSGTVLELH
jgi:hypothetical protein